MLFLDFIWMSILMVNTVITHQSSNKMIILLFWDYYVLSVPGDLLFQFMNRPILLMSFTFV